jgi:predicted membrane protein
VLHNYNININIVGLDVFILNFHVQPTQAIYIKAQLNNCHSVLMGEAAALALGATIIKALQLHSCNFLSDSQQLVHFFHKDQ